MAFFHRKLLNKSIKNIMFIIKLDCDINDHCEDQQPPPLPPPLPPPPPPPPSTSSDYTSLSPLLILMFCGLAVSFSFICYLTLSRRFRRERNPETTMDEVFFDRDLGPPVVNHPVWLINSVGLNQSEIESVGVFKYKKDQGLIEGTDCSVCLSEFQDHESLRLLPKCSHAFHVPCIDTWLRSHKNCPLCRAPILKNSSGQTDAITDSNLVEEETAEIPSEDFELSIEVVERTRDVEIENNREVAEKTSIEMRVCSDLANRVCVRGEESVVAMRRSVSMNEFSVANLNRSVKGKHLSDRFGPLTKYESMQKGGHHKRIGSGSSSSVSIRIRAMKRSSFGHSTRKASSFTKGLARLGSYNRSY